MLFRSSALGRVSEEMLARATSPCMAATLQPELLEDRVRSCPPDVRDGFKVFKHMIWFQQPAGHIPILWQLPEPGNIRVLAQYRLGAHQLACEADRAAGLRDMRFCGFCSDLEVEDELHVLMCPAWQRHRDRLRLLFGGASYQALKEATASGFEVDKALNTFVNMQDKNLTDCLAGYLKLVWRDRKHTVVR